MIHFLLIVILVPLAFLMIPVWVAAIFDRPAPTGKNKKIVCDTYGNYGLKPEDFNHLTGEINNYFDF